MLNLSVIHLRLGQVEAAGAAARQAEDLFLSEGQEFEAVQALENRGFIAYCTGDLPTTFTLYDAAASGYAALGVEPADLAADQCVAFLAAGLVEDAVDVVTAQLSRDSLHAIQRAELLLMLATAQALGRPLHGLAGQCQGGPAALPATATRLVGASGRTRRAPRPAPGRRWWPQPRRVGRRSRPKARSRPVR